jgi:peptidyl-prolyl cis-trans isomerase C
MNFLREPLVQFFFIGMCIYGAYALYGTPDEGLESNTIVVDASRIDAFKSAWQQRWNRPPTEQELNGLINQFVREDILYREAVAMGLDKDDPITRRRMAQKLEFLSKDIASLKEPQAGELVSYFEANRVYCGELPSEGIHFGVESAGIKEDTLTDCALIT